MKSATNIIGETLEALQSLLTRNEVNHSLLTARMVAKETGMPIPMEYSGGHSYKINAARARNTFSFLHKIQMGLREKGDLGVLVEGYDILTAEGHKVFDSAQVWKGEKARECLQESLGDDFDEFMAELKKAHDRAIELDKYRNSLKTECQKPAFLNSIP